MSKRVVSIQDISCLGQCSLTAALPVLTACGVECAVLPTALLSTHTGPEFTRPFVRSLTEDLPAIARHWAENGITFDAIAIGYLGSRQQIDLVSRFIDQFRTPETLVLLDPVMADNGLFYSGFDMDYARSMAALCAKCDMILPTLTEACLLLGAEPVTEGYDETFCLTLAERLIGLGAKTVLLTGLELEPCTVSNLIYDRDSAALVSAPRLPGRFHGTGDLFASALLGRLLGGDPLPAAAGRACQFVGASIANTAPDHRYGVSFENCLNLLMD